MNKQDLDRILRLEGFNPRLYSLNGGDANDTLCLALERGGWSVYYTERGARFNERWFESEDQACEHMLAELRSLPKTQTHIDIDKPIPLNSPLLAEAIRLWTGWRQSAVPNRDDTRLANQYGEAIAAKMLPVIKSLESDFYASGARLHAGSLAEMEKLVSEDFKRKHPTVADDIVRALAWCYTFDFK